MNKHSITANFGETRVTVLVVDLSEFIHAGPDDKVLVADADGSNGQVRKGDLSNFAIEG